MVTPFISIDEYGIKAETIDGIKTVVLMQFTGLLANDGKEIWESDIVAHLCPHCEELHVGFIVWVDDLGCWGIKQGEQIAPLIAPVNEHNLDAGIGLIKIQSVVGNIHQNADLLGDSNG